MRDYWVDLLGDRWPVIESLQRLKFSYPAHAALRRHVFLRDRFTCIRCGAEALHVPADYDGTNCLLTNTFSGNGWPDVLVLDHKLTLKAGGRNVVSNLQTLCETCNRRKQREDKLAIKLAVEGGENGR